MKTNKEIAVAQHAKDADFQVTIDLSVTLPNLGLLLNCTKTGVLSMAISSIDTLVVVGCVGLNIPCLRNLLQVMERIKDAIQDAIQLTASVPQSSHNQEPPQT